MVEILSFDYSGDPIHIFQALAGRPFPFFLDSNLYHGEYGRYSFIGCDPFKVFESDSVDTIEKLREEFLPYQKTKPCVYTPFASGIVGFLGYDLGRQRENGPTKNPDDSNIPGSCFGFYDTVITIDHFSNKLYLCTDGNPKKAVRLEELIRPVLKSTPKGPEPLFQSLNPPADIQLESNFTKQEYLHAVQKALDHIRRGDIYQVNLSQRFRFSVEEPFIPLEIYQWLRKFSPSSFAAYFGAEDYQILSSSPERFIKKCGNRIETRPMKGTRPRGETLSEDIKQKEDLQYSEKDKAELLMITDLERNDLGRVCEFGSVKVKNIRTIEEYRTVYQATSTVEGQLVPQRDVFDVLSAAFPGGSITGCPKIRSMQIIDQLEPTLRGPYTGSLGFISFSGDMDFNILIRTLVCTKKNVTFHVGAGIVADSDSENEYRETLVKAKAMRECLSYVFRPHKLSQTNAENI